MTALATWNPFAEWTEAQCRAEIARIQAQLATNAKQITTTSGGATYGSRDEAERDIWYMRCRIAEILGDRRPTPPPKLDASRLGMRYFAAQYDGGY